MIFVLDIRPVGFVFVGYLVSGSSIVSVVLAIFGCPMISVLCNIIPV